MIVVRRYRDLPEAELASAALEAAGIENSLADAETVGIMWSYSNAFGGIRLQVADVDAVDAQNLLAADTPPPEDPAAPVEDEGNDGVEPCEECGSSETMLRYGARRTLALWLIIFPSFLILPFFWRTRACCRACGVCRVIPFRVRPHIVLGYLSGAIVCYFLFGAILLLVVLANGLISKIR